MNPRTLRSVASLCCLIGGFVLLFFLFMQPLLTASARASAPINETTIQGLPFSVHYNFSPDFLAGPQWWLRIFIPLAIVIISLPIAPSSRKECAECHLPLSKPYVRLYLYPHPKSLGRSRAGKNVHSGCVQKWMENHPQEVKPSDALAALHGASSENA
jgi:hypothetical protein